MQAVLSHCDGNLELAAATLPTGTRSRRRRRASTRSRLPGDRRSTTPSSRSRSREEEEQMAQMSGPAPGMGTRPAPEGTRWTAPAACRSRAGRRGRRCRGASRAGGAPGARRGRRAAREGVGARQEDPRGARRPRRPRRRRRRRQRRPRPGGTWARRSGEGDNFTPLLSAGGDDSGSMAQAELVPRRRSPATRAPCRTAAAGHLDDAVHARRERCGVSAPRARARLDRPRAGRPDGGGVSETGAGREGWVSVVT